MIKTLFAVPLAPPLPPEWAPVREMVQTPLNPDKNAVDIFSWELESNVT